MRTFGGKARGDGRPDALTGPGYEGNSTCKTTHFSPPGGVRRILQLRRKR